MMSSSRATVLRLDDNPSGGRDDFRAAVAKAVRAGSYFEFGGGCGDIVNQSSQTDVFARLDAVGPTDVHVVVVLITHNPHAWELFGFHRNAERLVLLTLPVSEVGRAYDRHAEPFRRRHGLPVPCPEAPVDLRYGFQPCPSSDDVAVVDDLPVPFAVLAATASCGPADPRSVPSGIVRACVETLLSLGVRPVAVGRTYRIDNRFQEVLHVESATSDLPGVLSTVDRLSAGGVAAAVRKAALTVACDSATGCMARTLHRPTFNLVSDDMWRNCNAVESGYGSWLHEDFFYCAFRAYSDEHLRKFTRRFL